MSSGHGAFFVVFGAFVVFVDLSFVFFFFLCVCFFGSLDHVSFFLNKLHRYIRSN